MTNQLQFFPLRLGTFLPLFKFGIHERYEDILEDGYTVVSASPELTIVLRENMDYPEFRRKYTSKFKWTVGNVVGHMYKLIDEYLEYHGENSDYFVDRSICGFSYDSVKKEIHIDDQN